MGLGVAGLAVLGLSIFFLLFLKMFVTDSGNFYEEMTVVLEALAGFSLGAESIALFARVGGGIYTKAADVGADLVVKAGNSGIPEDDPRNPATIADNVGDNVGDVAGMGADLFGSYVATVLASMVLGIFILSRICQKSRSTLYGCFSRNGADSPAYCHCRRWDIGLDHRGHFWLKLALTMRSKQLFSVR